tara:strand:- start:763 stop:921 length:159 start_codon:yes stop_codon:yes gene_type:complete
MTTNNKKGRIISHPDTASEAVGITFTKQHQTEGVLLGDPGGGSHRPENKKGG